LSNFAAARRRDAGTAADDLHAHLQQRKNDARNPLLVIFTITGPTREWRRPLRHKNTVTSADTLFLASCAEFQPISSNDSTTIRITRRTGLIAHFTHNQ
jgi:hypothetical protein